ncbi:hypothetical protein BDV95DRAFT_300492 [Massariosphaeria phaeospora]|uniref:Uncharacterized protein n=1 Tax=Massariosphaeria phaeospora TaxID=100035 RepID=A0A7C8IEB6_9PLEO|nr:hypothetical protein BDV95DRAFT_300492 [Massariosphaeria phaeospora]
MSAPQSESSLPTHPAGTFRSSPPVLSAKHDPDAQQSSKMSQSEAPVDHKASSSRPHLPRASSADTERPPSAQRVRGAHTPPRNANSVVDLGDGDGDRSDDEEDDNETAGPAEKIADFDWNELAERYHEATTACEQDEEKLMEEWQRLMDYFKIWANSGHAHESERTYARLQTRMIYVNHEEETLESARKHYISVVQAFESALRLLDSATFSR